MRMRRALSVVMLTALAVMVGSPLGAPFAGAQSASVDAWIEFATVEPGAGCVVDVSADGGAVILALTAVGYSSLATVALRRTRLEEVA